MFLGRHAHNLDEKGRLAIPARFRDLLADGLVLTRGIDQCIAAYPRAAWDRLAEQVNALSMADRDARQFRRMVFAEAADVALDRQGRIMVPPELRRYAGIERETVIVGVHTSIEIWSPARWDEVSGQVEDSGEEIAARLTGML
jgi:MraZ protein